MAEAQAADSSDRKHLLLKTCEIRRCWRCGARAERDKLEGHMTEVLAMLTEAKKAVSTKLVADQCFVERGVEDPADERKELAETRAKAWQAENSAPEARMADLKEFEESRTSSFDTERHADGPP